MASVASAPQGLSGLVEGLGILQKALLFCFVFHFYLVLPFWFVPRFHYDLPGTLPEVGRAVGCKAALFWLRVATCICQGCGVRVGGRGGGLELCTYLSPLLWASLPTFA